MPKLIKTWEELGKVESSKNYKIELDVSGASAWIVPKKENSATRGEDYLKHHVYLSTHTFYSGHYKKASRILKEYGFDVELYNWDEDLPEPLRSIKINEFEDEDEEPSLFEAVKEVYTNNG